MQFSIINSSVRRRNRRRRALARLQVWKIKTGQLFPDPPLVQRLLFQLSTHHSKDTRYLRNFLDIVNSIYSNMEQTEGRFTIWASTFMRRLCLHDSCFQYTFCQGPLGQVSLKPTTCMLLRLPSFPRHQRKLATFKGPFESLGGQNSDGSWKTSRAKEFPPNLCQAIAEAVLLQCCQVGCQYSGAFLAEASPQCLASL